MAIVALLFLISSHLSLNALPSPQIRNNSVIVIGAGVSGLSAAKTLREHGFSNVKILEANDRIGGRACTKVLAGESYIEMGAQFVHGEKNNAVFELATARGLMSSSANTNQNLDEEVFLTDQGAVVNEAHVEAIYKAGKEAFANRSITNFSTIQEYSDYKLWDFYQNNPNFDRELTRALWYWVEANQKSYDGCDSLSQISPASFSEFRECEGNQQGHLQSGYISIVRALAENLPNESFALRQTVTTINSAEGNGVKVLTEDGTVYRADHVIVTVSLGVLKDRARGMFVPGLPTSKLEAYQAVGFGTVDKVFLEFETAFWEDDKIDSMGLVWTGDTMVTNSSWEYGIFSFNVVSTFNNTLCGWISGETARKMERQTKEEITSTCEEVLKKFTGRKILPRIVNVYLSNWFTNKNFKGSYSFRTVESNRIKGLNNILSEPVYGPSKLGTLNSPKIMFAGEHTHPYYYSTVHGAMESGEREAKRLIKYYEE